MPANWFPGHMRSGLREIEQRVRTSELIIEILDARAPRASQHPLMMELRREKPTLRILNKADLADPQVTSAWIRSFRPQVALAVSLESERSATLRKIPSICRQLGSHAKRASRPIHAIVVGVPNVGKSTLINNLKGRRVLVARNEPGVTRKGQAVRIDQGFYVWDTPGVLWPSLTDHDQLVRLAAIGTIPDAAIDVHDVAAFVLEYLARHYPDALRRTYGLNDLDRPPAVLLEDIGRLRGHVAPRGLFDSTRSARALIQDLRSGKLGRISVERPEAGGPQPEESS